MPGIFEMLLSYFGDDPSASRIADEPALHLWVDGRNGRWACVAQAREDEHQVLFYSVWQRLVPADRRPAMAEFLTRANWGLPIGNFELDWDGGGVRFKTSLDIEGERLSRVLIEGLIKANLTTMDRYLPGIVAVVETDAAPAHLIAQLESDTSAILDS